MTPSKAKQIVSDAMNKGGNLLGHMLWWTLADVRVDATAFKAAWTNAGLTEKYLPETPGADRALRIAGTRAVNGNTDANGTILFRFATKTPTHSIFNIVRERKDADGKGNNGYDQIAQISVDAAGTVASDHPTNDYVKAVRAKFDTLWGAFTAEEVRAGMIRLVDIGCAGVTLRDGGGFYFVPAPFAAQVDALKAVVEKFIPGSSVTAIPMTADPGGKAAAGIAVSAKGGMETELANLRDEMDRFAAAIRGSGEPDAKGVPRASTMSRRVEEYEALRRRATMYHDVLALNVDDLNAQIATMEERARTMLDVLSLDDEEQAALLPTLDL
jgi:hypothetical protein